METNAEGHTVLTQWFERARFEYHPDNAAPYKVLLGRLGAQVRNERGRYGLHPSDRTMTDGCFYTHATHYPC